MDDDCYFREPGEKPKNWKHPPPMEDICDSASIWTGAIVVHYVILGTKCGIIPIEARDIEDQGALHTQESIVRIQRRGIHQKAGIMVR
jgi:hypothetical protein